MLSEGEGWGWYESKRLVEPESKDLPGPNERRGHARVLFSPRSGELPFVSRPRRAAARRGQEGQGPSARSGNPPLEKEVFRLACSGGRSFESGDFCWGLNLRPLEKSGLVILKGSKPVAGG